MQDIDTSLLIAQRNTASAAYYSTGDTVMTDDAFDALTEELTRRGEYEVVGHGTAGGKVLHARPMLSLKKVHAAGEVSAWAETVRGPVLVEPKFDGLAASLVFGRDGQLIRAVTRGDGEKCDDITRHVRGLLCRDSPIGDTITAYEEGPVEREVRGEIVLTRPDFRELNRVRAHAGKSLYANPRNAAAGMIGRGDHSEAAAWLTFIQYDSGWTVDGAETARSLLLEIEGCSHVATFGPVEPELLSLPSIANRILDSAARFLAEPANQEEVTGEFPVYTDGVVFKALDPTDRARLGETSTAPRWAVAFKFPNRPKHTVLRAVEWSNTRTGRVVPVAVFDPVELSGAMVSRDTLNNIAFLEELDVWIGDTIEVTRANEVIPNVIRRIGDHTADAVPVEIPDGYRRDGRDLVHGLGRDIVKDISFAASKLDILGLGEDVVRRLVEGNPQVDGFPALLESCREDALVPFERATQKLVGKIENEVIEKTSGLQDPAKWIAAAGVPMVGVRAGKRLATLIVDDFSSDSGVIPPETVSPMTLLAILPAEKIAGVDGFGDAMATAVMDSGDVWGPWANLGITFDWGKYAPAALTPAKAPDAAAALPLAGWKVLVTGTLPTLSRKEAEARIEQLGGTVASSVSKALDLLVAGEKAGSKLAKAESLGIDVMDGAEFEALPV